MVTKNKKGSKLARHNNVDAQHIGEALAEMDRAKQQKRRVGGETGGGQQPQDVRPEVGPGGESVQAGDTLADASIGLLPSLMGGHSPC